MIPGELAERVESLQPYFSEIQLRKGSNKVFTDEDELLIGTITHIRDGVMELLLIALRTFAPITP